MDKKIIALITLLCLFLCLLATGCHSEAALERKICRAYAEDSDVSPEELSVQFVYEFADAWAIYIHGPFAYTAAIRNVRLGDYEFTFSSGQQLLIYRGGAFYSLDEAYSQGVLDDGMVKQLHENFEKPAYPQQPLKTYPTSNTEAPTAIPLPTDQEAK